MIIDDATVDKPTLALDFQAILIKSICKGVFKLDAFSP